GQSGLCPCDVIVAKPDGFHKLCCRACTYACATYWNTTYDQSTLGLRHAHAKHPDVTATTANVLGKDWRISNKAPIRSRQRSAKAQSNEPRALAVLQRRPGLESRFDQYT